MRRKGIKLIENGQCPTDIFLVKLKIYRTFAGIKQKKRQKRWNES
ncbi:hypothetical protein TFKS16_2045 [Tannerella forsythia KS16]|nr:hypothetical protein TF3313_2055 [Tannerella forsythia 3313]BAR52256.1 hypothetical protein TFKS16_2045 [Tannerella forsythia KS16]